MIERLLIPPSIHLVEQDLEVKARTLYDLVSDGLVKRVHIVEIECDGNCIDIDTEEDLKEWNLKTK